MIIINLFRLGKFNYVKKEISLDLYNFQDIKKQTYIDCSGFLLDDDICFWVYGGKLVTDNTDLTTIIHPICVYILTDVINNKSKSITNLYNNIMNIASVLDLQEQLFEAEMRTMLEMGFTDENRIMRALLSANGDIEYAIEIYSRV
jgi:hypothetical protein